MNDDYGALVKRIEKLEAQQNGTASGVWYPVSAKIEHNKNLVIRMDNNGHITYNRAIWNGVYFMADKNLVYSAENVTHFMYADDPG